MIDETRMNRLPLIWAARFRQIAIAGFLLSIMAGLLLPVYSDEIGWRFQERAGVDHGIDVMFNDLCGPNSLGHPPWFMMPARWYSAIANQTFAAPLFIRIEGVLCALAWAAMLWTLVARLEPDRARRMGLQALAFALLGMGVLPFLLVLSRPEQPIVLCYALMMLVAFSPVSGRHLPAWLKCGAIVALLAVAGSYHVKGVLYAPVALACLIFCARGSGTVLPRGLAALAAIAVALSAGHYWAEHLKCVAGDPLLAAHYARENVVSLLTSAHPHAALLVQFISGLNPLAYVALALPSNQTMSHWLPDGLFPVGILLVIDTGMMLVWVGALVSSLRALLWFASEHRVKALLEPRVPVALAILGCVVVWGMTQLKRNDYEAGHVLPMLAVFCMLALSLPRPDRAEPVRTIAAAAVCTVFSQIIVLALVVPVLASVARVPGYLDKQPYSVALGDYGKIRRDIDRAMQMAGIPRDRPLNRLLIDDVTYLALQRTTLPLHRLGVVGVWNDGIDDPVDYLLSRHSDGVVIGCRYLPPAMRAAASRSGEVCAISHAGLERLDQAGSTTSARAPCAELRMARSCANLAVFCAQVPMNA